MVDRLCRPNGPPPQLGPNDPKPEKAKIKPMQVIGNCPHCGAPVYGHHETIEVTPEIRYSCMCRVSRKFEDMIQTK